MKRKTVSLSCELHLMMDAIKGVRSLTKQWVDSFGMDTDLPHQISALLALITERIRFADRVLRGTIDPRLAWCPENDGDLHRDAGAEDHVLVEWSEQRQARHHREEWRRAKRRLALKKSPKKPESEGTK
jgi:hypothetical protein